MLQHFSRTSPLQALRGAASIRGRPRGPGPSSATASQASPASHPHLGRRGLERTTTALVATVLTCPRCCSSRARSPAVAVAPAARPWALVEQCGGRLLIPVQGVGVRGRRRLGGLRHDTTTGPASVAMHLVHLPALICPVRCATWRRTCLRIAWASDRFGAAARGPRSSATRAFARQLDAVGAEKRLVAL